MKRYKLLLIILLIVGCDNSNEPEEVYGCTDSTATNFDSSANIFDNTCIYSESEIYGCTNYSALNYSSLATVDDGSCIYESVLGEAIKNVTMLHYFDEDTSYEWCHYRVMYSEKCENRNHNPNGNINMVSNILHLIEIDEYLIIPRHSEPIIETPWIFDPPSGWTVEYEYEY